MHSVCGDERSYAWYSLGSACPRCRTSCSLAVRRGLRVLGHVRRLCFCLDLARMVQWLGEFEGVLVSIFARCMAHKGMETLGSFQQ